MIRSPAAPVLGRVLGRLAGARRRRTGAADRRGERRGVAAAGEALQAAEGGAGPDRGAGATIPGYETALAALRAGVREAAGARGGTGA